VSRVGRGGRTSGLNADSSHSLRCAVLSCVLSPVSLCRAWEEVSKALQKHDHNTATAAKTLLEDAQRKLATERAAKKIPYKTKMFQQKKDGFWHFNGTE
jgi:hypothetical protein